MKLKQIKEKCKREWDAEDGGLEWDRISHYLDLAYKKGKDNKFKKIK